MAIIGFRDRVTVYTRDGNGTYTTVHAADVPCSLIDLATSPGSTAAQRQELGAMRGLIWDVGYDLPDEYAQIEVDGTRWNVRAGTVHRARFPSGTPLYRYADVMRAR